MHEQLIQPVASLTGRSVTRRGAMVGSAKLIGGGAMAAALVGGPVIGRTRTALAQDPVSEFEDVLDVFKLRADP